jgi:hypothetical protein
MGGFDDVKQAGEAGYSRPDDDGLSGLLEENHWCV